MDDLVTRIPGVANQGVTRIEPEDFNPNPDRGKRQQGRNEKGREEQAPDDEAPVTPDHKMDILV